MSGRNGLKGAKAPETTVLDMYRGRQRLALLRDLALNEWTHRELASQIGVPAHELAVFAALHEDEVTEVRKALAGQLAIETAGLWVSKRHNRVAEYQRQLEALEADIDTARLRFGPGSKEHINLVRTYFIGLRNAADEYLPSRLEKAEADGEANIVHYVIEGDSEIVKALT
jgi:hypothetical protein